MRAARWSSTTSALALLVVLAGPAAPGNAACDAGWSVLRTTLSEGASAVGTSDVAAVGEGELWVAGGIRMEPGGEGRGFLAHRQDGTWTRTVLAPGLGVRAVAAVQGAAWAVGQQEGSRPLVLRWSGHTWERVVVDLPAGSALAHVAISAADDVWAAGTWTDGQPFALHFDGRRWVRHVFPGVGMRVLALDASGPHDAWLVGQDGDASRWSPASWHWDGRRWRKEVLTGYGGTGARLQGVRALPDGTVWAVGMVPAGSCCDTWPLVARHTPTGWQDMTGMLRMSYGNPTDVVVGRGSSRPTVIGSVFVGDSGGGADVPYVAELVGTRWLHRSIKGYSAPPPPYWSTSLYAADGDGAGNSWVVGMRGLEPLLLQRCRGPAQVQP